MSIDPTEEDDDDDDVRAKAKPSSSGGDASSSAASTAATATQGAASGASGDASKPAEVIDLDDSGDKEELQVSWISFLSSKIDCSSITLHCCELALLRFSLYQVVKARRR